MIKFAVVLALAAVAFADPIPEGPKIEWGKCPQLKPSDSDRDAKAKTIEACIKDHPAPSKPEEIAKHAEQLTTCALKKDGWFNDNGTYKFERAKSEIQNKKLPADIETMVLGKHDECQKEAVTTHEKDFIAQVQLYQSCMDFHISSLCGIKVEVPQGAAPPS